MLCHPAIQRPCVNQPVIISEDPDRGIGKPQLVRDRLVAHVGGAFNDQTADRVTMKPFEPCLERISGTTVRSSGARRR
jgi:hypothetical protein